MPPCRRPRGEALPGVRPGERIRGFALREDVARAELEAAERATSSARASAAAAARGPSPEAQALAAQFGSLLGPELVSSVLQALEGDVQAAWRALDEMSGGGTAGGGPGEGGNGGGREGRRRRRGKGVRSQIVDKREGAGSASSRGAGASASSSPASAPHGSLPARSPGARGVASSSAPSVAEAANRTSGPPSALSPARLSFVSLPRVLQESVLSLVPLRELCRGAATCRSFAFAARARCGHRSVCQLPATQSAAVVRSAVAMACRAGTVDAVRPSKVCASPDELAALLRAIGQGERLREAKAREESGGEGGRELQTASPGSEGSASRRAPESPASRRAPESPASRRAPESPASRRAPGLDALTLAVRAIELESMRRSRAGAEEARSARRGAWGGGETTSSAHWASPYRALGGEWGGWNAHGAGEGRGRDARGTGEGEDGAARGTGEDEAGDVAGTRESGVTLGGWEREAEAWEREAGRGRRGAGEARSSAAAPDAAEEARASTDATEARDQRASASSSRPTLLAAGFPSPPLQPLPTASSSSPPPLPPSPPLSPHPRSALPAFSPVATLALRSPHLYGSALEALASGGADGAPALPLLRRLDLSGCSWGGLKPHVQLAVFRTLAREFPHLEEISLSRTDVKTDLAKRLFEPGARTATGLRALDLSACPAADVQAVLGGRPRNQLERLAASRNGAEAITLLLHAASPLRELRADWCERLRTVRLSAPRLERVDLRACRALEYLEIRSRSLRALLLTEANSLTALELPNPPTLETLELTHAPRLANAALFRVAQAGALRGLATLRVEHCADVSSLDWIRGGETEGERRAREIEERRERRRREERDGGIRVVHVASGGIRGYAGGGGAEAGRGVVEEGDGGTGERRGVGDALPPAPSSPAAAASVESTPWTPSAPASAAPSAAPSASLAAAPRSALPATAARQDSASASGPLFQYHPPLKLESLTLAGLPIRALDLSDASSLRALSVLACSRLEYVTLPDARVDATLPGLPRERVFQRQSHEGEGR